MKKDNVKKDRKWLTKKDVMRYLSVSKRTIENWVNDGVIRSYRLGGRVFFDQYELDDDIANSRTNTFHHG